MSFSKMFTGQNGRNYAIIFALVSTLFFLWGTCNGMLDVLNKHFQNTLHITRAQSGLVQFANYIAYFLMAIPAGMLARRFGYKAGIIIGLSLIALGAFWFIPATSINTFAAFLAGLFTIAIGLACLETVANPYTTVLGPPENGAARINLAQSCNGIGWIFGPVIGGRLLLSATGEVNQSNSMLYIPYLIIAAIVVVIAAIFIFSYIPDIKAEEEIKSGGGASASGSSSSMWRIPFGGVIAALILPTVLVIAVCAMLKQMPPAWLMMAVILFFPIAVFSVAKRKHFSFGVIAQFLYVAAQTGIFSFFINYMVENLSSPGQVFPDRTAANWLAFGGFGLFFLGRLSAGIIMNRFRPHLLLAVYSFVNVGLMAVTIMATGGIGGKIGVGAMVLSFFFMSIMFPTIFALGIKGLGEHTKQGSSIIVMAILGGAIMPILMGHIADAASMRVGFVVPLICFVLVGLYAAAWQKLETKDAGALAR